MKPEHNPDNNEHQVDRLLENASFNYSRSKDDVWNVLKEKMDTEVEKEAPVVPVFSQWARMGIAAAIALLLLAGIGSGFYTVDIEANAGQTRNIELPDGSKVQLNSETTLSYKPIAWYWNRTATLEGEAFFEVVRGSTFSVTSSQGTTSVLGTSFNIYSRGNDYQVFCETGKVSVEVNDDLVILDPGQMANVDPKMGLVKQENVRKEYVLSWTLNKFIYNTTALAKVVDDIERHYDVDVQMDINNPTNYYYTGIFDRSIDAESALEIVCHSFDFSLISISDRSFVIEDK